jgi:hypothetical protein
VQSWLDFFEDASLLVAPQLPFFQLKNWIPIWCLVPAGALSLDLDI